MNQKMLGVTIERQTQNDILDKIVKNITSQAGFLHIVSLNPENLVIAQENEKFRKALNDAQIRIVDGFGIVLASKILNVEAGERVTGINLMKKLIDTASKMRLKVLLIGGRPNLALRLAECYGKKYPEAEFLGIEGVANIQNPKKEEEEKIFSIVLDYKPNLVFVAFGSPDQELWLSRHKDQFINMVCMGVGGAFDYLSGTIPRAPFLIRKIGLEWVFRLVVQPWRWRRQLRLISFLFLVSRKHFCFLGVKRSS